MKTLKYILISLPVVMFFIITVLYSQEILYNDDYPAIVEFLSNNEKLPTIWGSVQYFFSTYGSEHKIFFVHFFSWLQVALLGKLNITTLVLIGNLGFLVGYIFILRSARLDSERKLLYLIPTSFLLFHLQSWSNNIWAMASLSNTLIFGWIILSLFYIFKEGRSQYFILGLIFAIAASYTNGNGMFVLFIAAFTLVCLKHYKKAAITFGLFLLIVSLNLSTSAAGGSLMEKLATQGLERIVGIFFVFLGSNFFHPSFIFVSIIAGVIFTMYFAYLFFFRKYYRINPVIFSLLVFIFLTAFAVATQRETLTVYTAAPSRYRVYGSLLIALSYISMLEVFAAVNLHRFVKFIAIPLAGGFFIVNTLAGRAKMEKRVQLNNAYSFLLENGIPLDKYIDSMYRVAINEGYVAPQGITASSLSRPVPGFDGALLASDVASMGEVDTIVSLNDHVLIKGWAGKKDNGNTLNQVYVTAHLPLQGSKVYKANFLEVYSFINDKEMLPYATCGYLASIPRAEYDAADSISVSISRGLKDVNIYPVYSIINDKIHTQ